MLNINKNKIFKNFSSLSYTRFHCLETSTFVIARRSISFVISGSQNEINCKTQNFKLTNCESFGSYVKPFLIAFKDHYPMTNRSTVESTLLNILQFAVVFPLILTTSCYDYIHNNQKAYSLPVGISKVLDYVCIRTSKYSTSETLGSLIGVVSSSYSLQETIEYLKHILTEVVSHGKTNYSDDIHTLCRLVGICGYTVTVHQLHTIITALVIQLESYLNNDGSIDFGSILESISVLSTTVIRLPVCLYTTTKSSTDKVGIYKFRNSSKPPVYHISPKGFESMDESGKQACFIFLALLRPTYVTNGVAGPNVNADDMNLDASQHPTLSVIRSLLSFQATPTYSQNSPVNQVQDAGIKNEGVRTFSTDSRPFLTTNSLNGKQSFSMQYNRCHIWCANPLPLTIEDAFPLL